MISIGSVLIAAALVVLGYVFHRRYQYERRFAHIPGPSGVPILKNALQLDFPKLPWILTEWGKTYGSVYKVGLMGTYAVVINGYDAIHDGIFKSGRITAGRPSTFRIKEHFKETGFFQPFPDEGWKLSRRLFHQFTKQFDVGLHVLEEAIASQSAEMYARFENAAEENTELDPYEIVQDTALKVILLIIGGEPVSDDDPVFLASKKYEALVWNILDDTGFDATLLETFPWLLHAPLRMSQVLKKAKRYQREMALELKRRAMLRDADVTLIGYLNQGANVDDTSVRLSEDDILFATTTAIFGGRGTTSVTFNYLLNVLAHHQNVQARIFDEIVAVSPDPDESIKLKDREYMPYTRATILEQFRYHTTVAVPGPKRTTRDIAIKGITVPEGTQLMVNLWGLHHDKEFWGDPENFRPERFLDEAGNLVPADHPTRRHVMPFSTGIRSCPAEQFAMSRIFLWLSNICKKVIIIPGEENTPETIRQDAMRCNFIMYPPRFKVGFTKRVS